MHRVWEGHGFSRANQIEEVQVVTPGPQLSAISFHHQSKRVILSGAGTSRSEAPAESKDPYTLSLRKNASGNPPRALGLGSAGAPSLRVLCARVGFHDRVPHGVLHVILGGAAVHCCGNWLVFRLGFSR